MKVAETKAYLENDARKNRAARMSVASNAVLTLMKIAVVAVTGSVSVLAETVNSAADLLGSAVALSAVRAADEPPDETHAYGHGKFENLSGVLIALLIIGGAAYALGEAVVHLVHRTAVRQTAPAIVVMALSAAANIVVSRHLLKTGLATDSPALVADGRHLQTDVVTSGSVFLSLVLTRVTGIYWIDPAVAIVITFIIFWVGMQIARDAVLMLSDIALPADEERLLRRVLDDDPRILGYHKLRTRKSGSHRHIDVHVQIDDRNSFVEAHRYSEEIEDNLRAALPNLHPIIHIEPFEDEAQHQREAHADQSPLP